MRPTTTVYEQNMQTYQNVIVMTFSHTHGRVYHSEYAMHLPSSRKMSHESWLACACETIAKISRGKRLQRSVLYNIQTVLNLLFLDPKALKILNIPPENLTSIDIASLLSIADTHLLNNDNAASTRKKSYYDFQKFIFEYLPKEKLTKPIDRHTTKYKAAIIQIEERTRTTLNSTPNKFDQSGVGYHLEAIPHSSYNDLIDKSIEKINNDLNRIIDGATKDLEEGKMLREKINKLSQKTQSIEINSIVERFIFKPGMTTVDYRNTSSIHKEDILTAYLHLTAKHNLLSCNAPAFYKCILSKQFNYLSSPDWPALPSIQLLAMNKRLCSVECHAIFILLLCRTGWNKESLGNLTVDGIRKLENGDYELQSYKSKTDDDTPTVFIDKSESKVIYALRCIQWNRLRLIRLGFLDQRDKRLWFAWGSGLKKYEHQSVSLFLIPYPFIKRHKLFNFSLDQIRQQVLNQEFYNNNSVETTRRIAGHRGITTSGRYLRNFLSHKINSSLMLEFQKKLETKVLWNLGSKLVQHVNGFNLIPVGDGSLCRDPATPPSWVKLEPDGICNAMHCHGEEGCPNNEIIIDENRIEEVVRKNHYYKNNWKRLHSENKEKFDLQIAPIAIFNSALYDFIKNSSHGHILKKIEKVIFP